MDSCGTGEPEGRQASGPLLRVFRYFKVAIRTQLSKYD
jgi:hypothetical protein